MIKFTTYILITLISCYSSPVDSYTIGINNSSDFTVSIDRIPDTQNLTNSSYFATYTSFKDDCYPGSMNKKPNKINIRVYSSMSLLTQFGNKKKLINHINQLFSESNKIFINQINIKLIPSIVIPKITHPQPINNGINVLGDLNSFGVFLRDRPFATLNVFITNNYQGIVGAAYINVLGSKHFNYAVSKNTDSTLSHEILHMFGAQHTFGKGGVMDYNNRLINGLLQMHIDNKPQVCACLNYYFTKIKSKL